MKNLCKITVVTLLLTGIGLAQQEVNPDHFEDYAAKQPVKTKHVVKTSQTKARVAQAKRQGSKSGNKTTASARVVAGN